MGKPAHADDIPETLPFDRRSSDRWEAIGCLEATRSDGLAPPTIIRLDLLNESAGGIAARTDALLPPGARLCVRANPEDHHWRPAVVVRCIPMGKGYSIGLAYERKLAA